jgi:hypothetical protein
VVFGPGLPRLKPLSLHTRQFLGIIDEMCFAAGYDAPGLLTSWVIPIDFQNRRPRGHRAPQLPSPAGAEDNGPVIQDVVHGEYLRVLIHNQAQASDRF